MRSTRLPGKMLADVGGKPLVAWTGQRARESGADQVVIATDHQSIADARMWYLSVAAQLPREFEEFLLTRISQARARTDGSQAA